VTLRSRSEEERGRERGGEREGRRRKEPRNDGEEEIDIFLLFPAVAPLAFRS